MPKYDYKCINCGDIKEGWGSFEVSTKYWKCSCDPTGYGQHLHKRIFSPSKNFILKGKGWGKDSYSKEKKGKEKK